MTVKLSVGLQKKVGLPDSEVSEQVARLRSRSTARHSPMIL